MTRLSLGDRLKYSLTQPHYPDVGIEFNSDVIRLAAVSAEKGALRVEHLDTEPLPAGAIDPNPFKTNIHDMEVVAEALKRLWSRNPIRTENVCLLLQDRSALTFHVNLEQPAGNRQECYDLIRFKLKKSVPFRIEEAQINIFDLAGASQFSGTTFWTVVMNQAVLHQYEQFIQSTIDAECGLVDLSTFNLMNLTHSTVMTQALQTQDLLFVNLNREYIATAISQKGNLMFYRSRPLERQNALFEEALGEIYPTTMFYVDKLEGKALARAFVYSVENPSDLATQIQNNLNFPAAAIAPEQILRFRPDIREKRVHEFAPLLGLVVSRKVEFQ